MEWISVKERMPEKDDFYLVKVGAKYRPVRVYEYNPSDWHENENMWRTEDHTYCFNHFVSHWMPLPKLPKEDAE